MPKRAEKLSNPSVFLAEKKKVYFMWIILCVSEDLHLQTQKIATNTVLTGKKKMITQSQH